ncbi:MAG: hypothetical protein QOI38_124, partial [Sphingomonadales bacterium]|nr:hypothetical protein [Sphingomonadales bacterium]
MNTDPKTACGCDTSCRCANC